MEWRKRWKYQWNEEKNISSWENELKKSFEIRASVRLSHAWVQSSIKKRIFPVQHANESNGVPLGENENKYSFSRSWRNRSWSKILLCTDPGLGHDLKHSLSNHLIKLLLGNTQGIQGLDGKCSSCSMSSVLQDLLSTGQEQNTSPGRIPGGVLIE